MTATQKTSVLLSRFWKAGINADFDQVNTLRRAELTLQRWAERECGDGSNWHIERDEDTGIPYNCIDGDSSRRYRCADLEKGALNRIKAICETLGIHYYHQTDPRGCALYVSKEPITDTNYTNAVAVCG